MILDVGDSVQLPVLITTFRTPEPNSETGRSRSLVRKCGTTYHNQSALLTVYIVSSKNLNFIFLTHVLMFEPFVYVYSCNALSARFFAVDTALNCYFMIMIMTMHAFDRQSDRRTDRQISHSMQRGKNKIAAVQVTARSFGMFSTLYSVRHVAWTLTCTWLTCLLHSRQSGVCVCFH